MQVTPPTELDPATESELDVLLAACNPSEANEVDFSGVAFCDSSGLRVLVRHQHRHAEAGGSLVVRNASTAIWRVFEITGLDTLFSPDAA